MSESQNDEILLAEIRKRSKDEGIEDFDKEWECAGISVFGVPDNIFRNRFGAALPPPAVDTCLCTHHPIRVQCYIIRKDVENAVENLQIVGNCCIRRFRTTKSLCNLCNKDNYCYVCGGGILRTPTRLINVKSALKKAKHSV